MYGHSAVNLILNTHYCVKRYTQYMLSDKGHFIRENYYNRPYSTALCYTLQLTCSTEPQGLVWSEIGILISITRAGPLLLVV